MESPESCRSLVLGAYPRSPGPNDRLACGGGGHVQLGHWRFGGQRYHPRAPENWWRVLKGRAGR